MPRRETEKTLKGWHVLAIALSAFGVILTANMALLFAATGSFPGTVVEDSYVAGVGWDDRAKAQDALGWRVGVSHTPEGLLAVTVEDAEGRAVRGLAVEAVVGRPAQAGTDTALALAEAGSIHAAPIALAPGLWRVALTVEGGGTPYRAVAEVVVPEDRATALPAGDERG